MLRDLIKWKQRPSCLTTIAYELCSVICENYSGLKDGKQLLFRSLEIGFRHLDPQNYPTVAKLVHTEHHEHMANIVFESGDDEIIADLLHAWTSHGDSHKPPPSLDMCAKHLVGLRPTSHRLRRFVIRAVELIGFRGFENIRVEESVGLLDALCVGIGDIDDKDRWMMFLLATIQHPEGILLLSHPYWELLVELSIPVRRWPRYTAWSSRIMKSLEDAKEWDRLGCWMGVVWMAWPPEADSMMGEDVRRVMFLLFRHQPGAMQKLEHWMERWSKSHGRAVPEAFRRICEWARPEATEQDAS